MSERQKAQWYFDFISPFAYFSWQRLSEFEPWLEIEYRPLLFAGLLNHWGQKGPAEIPAKRRWTYRWCAWWAQSQGIPLQMPARHPFNPLPYLRLALAADCRPAAITGIFDAIWASGADPMDEAHVAALAQQLDIQPEQLKDPQIKARLHAHGEQAISQQVFGVPTLCIGDELFWGLDGLDFARQWLNDASLRDSALLRGADTLPIGIERRR